MNLRDRKILELLIEQNLTVGEVANELGLSEVEIVKRAKELLAVKDVFTVLEQKQMLIYQLKSLYAKANDLLDTTTSGKEWPKAVEAITKLIETTYKIQVEQEEQHAKDMTAITEAQGVMMVRIVQMAYNRARELLTKEYPEVDGAKLDNAFTSGLVQLQKQQEIE